MIAAMAALGLLAAACESPSSTDVDVVVDGLDKPWDLGFLPDGTMLLTERPGRLSVAVDGQAQLVDAPDDVVAVGEGGMMGMAIDPNFANNGFVYVCLASDLGSPTDVRLARYKLSQDGENVLGRTDIVTGMPHKSTGRHSGCRPRFGPDGFIYVGTGDAAIGTVPQDDDSLGGKVLRVTRSGNAAPGNPGGNLWLSKGHRNIQGIAFRNYDGFGVSVEHGPQVDDEVNELVAGNFGWDPVPGYNESVPMTDTDAFPDAVPAFWSSGSPTLAPSGATFIKGANWGRWNGALAVAMLKSTQLRIFVLDYETNEIVEEVPALTEFGRLRSPVMGPDGLLYVTTDGSNGSGKVLQVSPRFNEE